MKKEDMFYSDWRLRGTSEEHFRDTAKTMEGTLGLITVKQKDIEFICYIGGDEKSPSSWVYFSPKHCGQFKTNENEPGLASYQLHTLHTFAGIDDSILAEMRKTNMFIAIRGKYYIVTEESLSSLGRQLGIREKTLMRSNGIERALFLGSIMNVDKEMRVLTQHQKSSKDIINKALGFYSKKYKHIPITKVSDFLDIAKEDGSKIMYWETSPTSISLTLKLPPITKKAEYEPCINVFLSNADEGAFSIESAVAKNGSCIIGPHAVSFAHKGAVPEEADLRNAYEDIKQHSYKYVRKVQKETKAAASVVVYDASNKKEYGKKNLTAALTDAIKKSGIYKIIGKDRAKEMNEAMLIDLMKQDLVTAKTIKDEAFNITRKNRYTPEIDKRLKNAVSGIIIYGKKSA